MQELSKTFITKEKLDEAIEFALSNPVDYNFALDLNGNMYSGRMSAEPNNSLKTNDGEIDQQKKISTG